MRKVVVEVKFYHSPGSPVNAVARCKCEVPAVSFGGPRALEELLAHLRAHVREFTWDVRPTIREAGP